MQPPRLADINCTRLRFHPGDRILVRSHVRMDVDQMKRLRSTISKWAGCEVEVFIYCDLDLDIQVDQRSIIGG